MTCTAILKTGPRKGQPCGAKSAINGFCGRHTAKTVTQVVPLAPAPVPVVPIVPKPASIVPVVPIVPKPAPVVPKPASAAPTPIVPSSDVMEYIPTKQQPKATRNTYMNYFKKMQKHNDDYANVAIFEWVCETYNALDRLHPDFARDMGNLVSGTLMHMISYQNNRYHVSPKIGTMIYFIEKLFEYRIPDSLRLKKPMILYRRAVHAYPPHQILFPIFTSASLSYKFARGWHHTGGCCLYKIKVGPEVNYFPATDMCHDPFQYEIVLPPGELMVEGTEEVEGIIHITGTYRPWTIEQWRKFITEAPVSKY